VDRRRRTRSSGVPDAEERREGSPNSGTDRATNDDARHRGGKGDSRPPPGVQDIIDTFGLPERTDSTITERDALYSELETICERGYAINDGETMEKVRAVANPILWDGTVCGAVGIAGPKHRLNGRRFTDRLPTKILEATDTVELKLEYQYQK
jgi:hypothetical protein